MQYLSNNTIMDKYGIDVVGTLVEPPIDHAKVFINAGDDMYDLVLLPNNMMQQFGTAGQLVNISGLEYVDFDHDCWNDYANKQLTYGGKLYYTTNKFLLEASPNSGPRVVSTTAKSPALSLSLLGAK